MTTTDNAVDMLLDEMKRLGYSAGTISLAKRQCLRLAQEPGFMDRGKDESKYNELGKGVPAACRRLVALGRELPLDGCRGAEGMCAWICRNRAERTVMELRSRLAEAMRGLMEFRTSQGFLARKHESILMRFD